jgi:hypothetical protein
MIELVKCKKKKKKTKQNNEIDLKTGKSGLNSTYYQEQINCFMNEIYNIKDADKWVNKQDWLIN